MYINKNKFSLTIVVYILLLSKTCSFLRRKIYELVKNFISIMFSKLIIWGRKVLLVKICFSQIWKSLTVFLHRRNKNLFVIFFFKKNRQLFLFKNNSKTKQLFRRSQKENSETLIRERQNEQKKVRTKQQTRFVQDVGNSKFVTVILVSDNDTNKRSSKYIRAASVKKQQV